MKRKTRVGRQQTNDEAFQAIENLAANIENTFRQLASAISTLRSRIQQLKKTNSTQYSVPKIARKRIENVAPGPPSKYRCSNSQSGFRHSTVTAFQRNIENSSFVETVNQMANKMEGRTDEQSLYDERAESETNCPEWPEFLQMERIDLSRTYPTAELQEIDAIAREKWNKMSQQERIYAIQAHRNRRNKEYQKYYSSNSRTDRQQGQKGLEKRDKYDRIQNKGRQEEKSTKYIDGQLKIEYNFTQDLDNSFDDQTQNILDEAEGLTVVDVTTNNADSLEDRIKQLFMRPN